MRTYYNILGVRNNATTDDIKNRYRILIKKHHPDKNNGCKESENIAKEIIQAYKTFINNITRKNMRQNSKK